ncbi:DUF6252 family protein [Flavobacterium sp. SM15]|uniref:DUF6252 family protein n=1 Tax=Flavobacterium sp. SM15 TaxID=2908005 RepID=UPI001EDA2F87|nr:DUF6252 family protein [Flavobacterium sp. SM15]MCG2610059.1 DUF6252 family protein [Flavobacterium sp. SM15]
MKKIVALLALVLAVTSCSEDIKVNSPAFQANKNNNFWQANSMTAFADANGITIVATVGSEIVTLHTNAATAGTYLLGLNDVNTATFESTPATGAYFETGPSIGSGVITITPNQTPGTITGKFEFVAQDEDGNEVNFTKGDFYKIPIQ